MANIDALRDKILKLGQKQKIGAVLKYIDNPNDDVRMAAAMALANLISDEELNEDYIIPAAFDERVGPAVAKAVAEAARKTGVARI